ncbi:hypothetical protein TNIN_93101 [Trichonephila inaurata madagascariensis]|uniref:Uncharacterized protein n=1 Tax=Trichonephila inaurata madagascariensis TaxID=2747483 RepID=A0A8X7CK33_9ARAC|nr:hypothetical protein TNIN_93101 [Trichonephila inaurata madagascariensis]
MLTGFRATARPSDPLIDPEFRGAHYRGKVSFYPLLIVRWSFSKHFSSPLDALTCNTKASDGVEDVRGTFRHTLHPFTGHRKGVSPVTERPLKSIPEVAYIKVAPVSGCVR